MAVKLSKRLTAITELIPEGKVLADIGTDHGYIPIYLCQNEKIPSALAMDVRVGPLERATEHIAMYALADRIETRLSDGLQELQPGEAQTILIAGMGGILMQRILTDVAQVARQAETLVLQPQSDLYQFRLYLAEQGYEILAEDMVEEDGKYYPMMKVVPGSPYTLTELQAAFGPLLLEAKHPVLGAWLEKELVLQKKILENLIHSAKNEGIEERMGVIRHRINLIEEAMW